nr:hypothetical protein [Aeromonas sp. Y311-2]
MTLVIGMLGLLAFFTIVTFGSLYLYQEKHKGKKHHRQ